MNENEASLLGPFRQLVADELEELVGLDADPNFSQDPVIWNTPEAMRVVRVNCPVNLEVYDAQGNLVAYAAGAITAAHLEQGIAMMSGGD